jgi:hypothetical protein
MVLYYLTVNVNIFFSLYKRMTKNKKKMGRKWSLKYKKTINCNRPKGFSQKQYCKYGRKKKTIRF